MRIIEVINPTYANEVGTVIDCEALYEEIGKHVPFSASPVDSELHGRQLYTELISGKYGPILPFVPPKISSGGLRIALTAEYERRMQAIAAGYPPSERESWPVQTQEAKALLADAQASTPWIDAAATARNIDRIELANRIVAKDAMYRVFSGTLSGVRQRIEDAIDAAAGDAQALQAIDVTAGWPKGT